MKPQDLSEFDGWRELFENIKITLSDAQHGQADANQVRATRRELVQLFHMLDHAIKKIPTGYDMRSRPHMLDLSMACKQVRTEADRMFQAIESESLDDPLLGLVDIDGHMREHRAGAELALRWVLAEILGPLLSNWGKNVPASRKAEILINREGPT